MLEVIYFFTYFSLYYSFKKLTIALMPHKKPQKKELSKKKDDENVEIGEFRGDIERVFGRMVTIFETFKDSYRYGDVSFNNDFKCITIIISPSRVMIVIVITI